MSIQRVVDHLYTIQERESVVTIRFLTSRTPWFLALLLIFGLFGGLIWLGFHLGWNNNFLSGLIGASISMVLSSCFAMAEHITRYRIVIEADLVSLQREFEGIPVGRKKILPRNFSSDLGVYLHRRNSTHGANHLLGKLCIWAEGRSIEIEGYFPIPEGMSLANDLRKLGIEFPRTYPLYEQSEMLFRQEGEYLSF